MARKLYREGWFRGLINKCGGSTELAKRIGATPDQVWKWRERDVVPPEWWEEIVQAFGDDSDVRADFAELARQYRLRRRFAGA